MANSPQPKRNVILYIGAFELPDKNAAAQRVLSNAKLFQSLGYEVVLVGRTRAEEMSDGGIRKADYPGIEFECWETAYPKSTRAWFRQIISTANIQQVFEDRLKGRLFALVCYNYPAIAQYTAKRFANRMGGYGIADVTEWYARSTVIKLSTIVKNIDTFLRMRIVNFRMDGLITTSRFLTNYYGSLQPNIVELPTLIERRGDHVDIKPAATKDGEPKLLFFAGSGFDPKLVSRETGGLKDRLDWVLELLFEVHKLGTDFRFEIFGVTKESYLDLMPQHASLVDAMAEKVVFHGRKPREELLKTLVKSDFSIFLRKEMLVTKAGFPTKFSESIAYGTPVITNMLENIEPFFVEDSNAVEMDYFDQPGSIARLQEVLEYSQAKVQSMKEMCLNSDQFSYKSFQQPAANMLDQIAKQNRPGLR